jgi:hypothetical protein
MNILHILFFFRSIIACAIDYFSFLVIIQTALIWFRLSLLVYICFVISFFMLIL